MDTVTLYLDNGEELECQVLTIFEAEGQDYIALLPVDSDDRQSGEVFIYRYREDESGEPVLENIEDDSEYEMVDEAFDEWLDCNEFDELVSEEELDFND